MKRPVPRPDRPAARQVRIRAVELNDLSIFVATSGTFESSKNMPRLGVRASVIVIVHMGQDASGAGGSAEGAKSDSDMARLLKVQAGQS